MTSATTPGTTASGTARGARLIARIAFHVLRVFVGLVLIATGVGKGLDIPGFVAVIGTYQLLPDLLHWPTAIGMTIFEMVLGVWLLSNRRSSTAGLISVALHSLFTLWAVIALLRGLDIPNCGCFGVFLARPLTWSTPIEDTVMILASFGVFVLGRAASTATIRRS